MATSHADRKELLRQQLLAIRGLSGATQKYWGDLVQQMVAKMPHVALPLASRGFKETMLAGTNEHTVGDHFIRQTFVGQKLWEFPEILDDEPLFSAIIDCCCKVIRMTKKEHNSISGKNKPWNLSLYKDHGIELVGCTHKPRQKWTTVEYPEVEVDLSEYVHPQILAWMAE